MTAALLLGGCGSAATPAQRPVAGGRTLPPAAHEVIAALAAVPGGGLRYGELASGAIRDLGSRRVLARVPVRSGGQRGLLGLAVDQRGRTFTASVDRRGNLAVDQVLPAPLRRVWTGPHAAQLGNGGHLAVLPDGRLVLGIGDLERPSRTSDRLALNGKLVALAPGAGPGQRPQILSSGWNNPFAFATTAGGRIWVADNAPGRKPERLGPGIGSGPRTPLTRPTAPSGLAVLSQREVAVCGVGSGRLDRYRRNASGQWSYAGSFATPCRFGVARLTGGDLIVSTDGGLRRLRR